MKHDILRPSKSGYHRGNLRYQLVELAVKRLDQGERVTDLKIRSLAAELGVSPGAPYRHFEDADSLIAAVAEWGFDLLAQTLRRVEPGDLPGLGAAYLDFALRHPQLYHALFHFPREDLRRFPDLAERAAEAVGILVRTVQAYQTSSGKRERDTETATLAAWAYVHGLAELGVNRLAAGLNPENHDFIRTLTRILTEGL